MISYISGRVLEVQHKELKAVIMTQSGLGYMVNLPQDVVSGLVIDQTIDLYCHLVVREDALDLYGFAEDKPRALFLRLIKINGVGPRIAMIMVGSLTVDDLLQAVAEKNIKILTKIPGVGPKLAQRLLLELGNVVEHLYAEQSQVKLPTKANEAVEALVKLGYDVEKARKVVQTLAGEASDTQQLIKLALKQLMPR